MWVYYLFLAVAVYAALTIRPDQQNKVSRDVEVPLAKEGTEIPVLFGTRDIKSPNVVWYGDVYAAPYTKKGGKK